MTSGTASAHRIPDSFRVRQAAFSRLCVFCFLSLLLVAGCPCNGNHPVNVDSVEIVPPLTHVLQGRTFRLEAIARNSLGRRTHYNGPVKWNLPAGLAFVGAIDANPITVKADNVLTGQIRDVTGITARIGNKTSQPASLVIGRTGTVRDEFQVSDAADPAAVIIDAAAGAACVNDLTLAAVSLAVLREDLTSSCGSEAAVFSIDRAAALGQPGWTTGRNSETLPATAPVQVPVIHYWATGATVDVTAVREQVNNANTILGASRAGVLFDVPTQATIVDHGTSMTPPYSGGCAAVAANLTAKGNDMKEPDLYAVYVLGISGSAKGFSCPPEEPDRAAGLIVVDASLTMDKTLAHELGHMFGLLQPNRGHTASDGARVSGFDWSNLMWAADVPDPDDVYRIGLSLGQVFRVNFHEASWLQYASLGGSQSKPCQCQPYDDTPCPALALDFGGVRTVPQGNSVFVCPPP